jgi:polar amino acid transport system substrate-binding protein
MPNRFVKQYFGLACATMCASATFAQSAQPLRIQYYERKPFHYTLENGNVVGLTATPTEQAFKKIGVTIRWELVPVNRILNNLKRNDEPLCTPGWYKKPEREEYAQFSAPIYRDKPLVGLARAGFAVKEGITAKELFASPSTNLLVKQNFSQGAYMDALIATMPPRQVIAVVEEIPNLVKMIDAKRADLIITTQEEVALYVDQAELSMKDFRVLVFPDVPAVEMRYILCSKQMPAETMRKLNKAIGNAVR